MSTKKRPGVQAGMDLAAQPENVKWWLDVEQKWNDLPIPHLHTLQQQLANDLSNKQIMTKSDLDTIVRWKFAVGKARPSIRKLLQSNADQDVEQHTRHAIQMAKKINPQLDNNEEEINETLAELEQLKGIGPATASAVLSLINPSVFCFMYDEVIDCFMPQRDYKRSTYLAVRTRCQDIARSLNDAAGGSPTWTTARVATVLWTACRDFAIHGTNTTQQDDGGKSQVETPSHRRKKKNTQKPSTRPKRQKR